MVHLVDRVLHPAVKARFEELTDALTERDEIRFDDLGCRRKRSDRLGKPLAGRRHHRWRLVFQVLSDRQTDGSRKVPCVSTMVQAMAGLPVSGRRL